MLCKVMEFYDFPQKEGGARRERNVIAQLDPSIPKEKIEQRAYEIYLQRGGQDGYDLADWIIAEQELMMEKARARRRGIAGSLEDGDFVVYQLREDEMELLLKDLYVRGVAPSQRGLARRAKVLPFNRDASESAGEISG